MCVAEGGTERLPEGQTDRGADGRKGRRGEERWKEEKQEKENAGGERRVTAGPQLPHKT